MTSVPTPSRSPLPFIVLGAAAVASLAANVAGGLNFPGNAPVEQAICFGLVIDMVAVIILAVIGIVVARQPLTVRPSSALSVVGLVFAAVTVVAAAFFAWVPGILVLAAGNLLHYSDETFVVFLLAPLWVTGLAFSAFSFRRGGDRRNNLFSVLGLGLGIAVFVLAAAASVIYGLGLST